MFGSMLIVTVAHGSVKIDTIENPAAQSLSLPPSRAARRLVRTEESRPRARGGLGWEGRVITSESTTVQQASRRLIESVASVIVGKEDVIELAVTALLCRGHLLFEDVPGSGKTTLAKALAASLGCTFNRVQFTPDLMPADITGISFYNQRSGEFELRNGPIFSQILLADEINRATPRTQSALLEAMQEGQVTIEGETLPLPAPFLVMATQNPIELEGTFPLPEAQLDRFLMRLTIGFPSAAEEARMIHRFTADDPMERVRPVISTQELLALQGQVAMARVEPSLEEYVITLVHSTRDHPSLDLGASPRASLALYHTSQALALQQGRDYVTPDDVKRLAPFVLSHRVILNAQARLRGLTAADIVDDVLRSVPVPISGQPEEDAVAEGVSAG